MKKTLKFLLLIAVIPFLISAPLSAASDPLAVPESVKSSKVTACRGTGGTPKYKDGTHTSIECTGTAGFSLETAIGNIINTLLFITGMVAVIMIVIGGLRYVTSNGDSNQASQAKNTILYAVIGLVVAIMAYAIVNFVVTNI